MFGFRLRAQEDFLTSQRKRLSMSSMHVHVSGPQFLLWRTKKVRFSWSVTERKMFLKRHKSQFKMFLEKSIVLEGIIQQKNVAMAIHGMRTIKIVTTVGKTEHAATFWTLILRTQNRRLCCLAVMAHIVFVKKTSRDYENEKSSALLEKLLRQTQSAIL